MAGNPIVPFDSLVMGERYLITGYRDGDRGKFMPDEYGRPIQDSPGMLLGKFYAGTIIHRSPLPFNQVSYKLDADGHERVHSADWVVFKSLKPNSVAVVQSLQKKGLPTAPGAQNLVNNILGYAGFPAQGKPSIGPKKPDGSFGGRRRRKTRKSKKRSRKTRRR